LPFILWRPFLFLYLWWRNETWLSKSKSVLLEIKIPRDTEKPIKAMEQVMSSIHAAVYHPPDWWEKWIDGHLQLSATFEIASIGGETHFYVRTGAPYRDAVEASIYSQYPNAEIEEADDYTKYVPQNIPNADWDLWAADYKALKDDHFPIRTYKQFEEEKETEQRRLVDPVATLLETMSKVKPGEQFWIQISCSPISEERLGHWVDAGKELRDRLARRPEKPQSKPFLREAADVLITGKTAEVEKTEERDIIPPEMKLTPGERDQMAAMEEKMSKPVFNCNVRFIYLGRRDVFFKPNFRLGFAYFNGYTTINLNALMPMGSTLTKIHKSWFLPLNLIRPRRHYLRCRKIFRNYLMRVPPFFPRHGGTFHLNTEEVASLFHFPSEEAAPAPGGPWVEAKRGGSPSRLPVE